MWSPILIATFHRRSVRTMKSHIVSLSLFLSLPQPTDDEMDCVSMLSCWFTTNCMNARSLFGWDWNYWRPELRWADTAGQKSQTQSWWLFWLDFRYFGASYSWRHARIFSCGRKRSPAPVSGLSSDWQCTLSRNSLALAAIRPLRLTRIAVS